jgi:hypothetical protein
MSQNLTQWLKQQIRPWSLPLKQKLRRRYHHYRIHHGASPYHVMGRPRPYRVLFVLSHMRSGSSLLTHVLVTNPAIIGYGETHIQYQSEGDVRRLLERVYGTLGTLAMNQTYVLDKLLHNHKAIDTVIQGEAMTAIFLLREPQGTLTSLRKLKPDWSAEKAMDYYVQRLQWLEAAARSRQGLGRASCFLTYGDLLERTATVLEGLQTFLGVDRPFSEQYNLLPTTGIKSIGDSSALVKAGHIVRRSPPNAWNPEDWPPGAIDQLEAAYHHTDQVLRTHCQPL